METIMASGRNWKLQDAKASFSEVVRRAKSEGPQHVTVRGKEACVIVSAEEFDRMVGAKPEVPLVEFLQGLRLDELDIERERDTGRDLDL